MSGERGIYVPRGRRELNKKRAKEDAVNPPKPKPISTVLRQHNAATIVDLPFHDPFGTFESNATSSTISKIPNNTSFDNSSTPFVTEIDVTKCGLVLKGFPSEYPQISKDQIAAQYIEKGAVIRWMPYNFSMIAVFKNESSCENAVTTNSSSIFKSYLLFDLVDPFRDEFIEGMFVLQSVLSCYLI